MGENIRVSDNLFVLPVDMEGRSVDDIAREAAERIVEMISKDQNVEYDEAMNFFYESEVFDK
ncbi:hypothetical protein [Butyrivibrio hungatei]|uniref:hypothetical protein n=1 Tax=Butyrivibrio hungatei TaxID=185008 RepID=UPI00042963D5|nr:hypothetical protein [Butyrivibrio hungatei]